MSELLLATSPPDFNFITLTIEWSRDELYERINRRVDRMINSGLFDEVELLYKRYGAHAPVFEGVGYKELRPCVTGKESLSSAVEKLKQASRNYAKGQLVWWRHRKSLKIDGNTLKSGGVLT